jgi:hypothetical protein
LPARFLRQLVNSRARCRHRDRRAGVVPLPASQRMLYRYANSTRRHQSPGLRRFAWRVGLGSGQPSLGKSANDQAILPPSGSTVRRRRESAARSCQALYPVVACGRQPTATMRDPCKAMHAVGVGANSLEILAERYSHPPERKSGTGPHQLKMTNSPPTCKIAIFRRRSAAAETKDTQSEPFLPDRPAH